MVGPDRVERVESAAESSFMTKYVGPMRTLKSKVVDEGDGENITKYQ